MADEKKPERHVTFMCRIQADHIEGLISELHFLQTQIKRGELTAGVSGSPSVGTIYALRLNPDATHESYFRQLEEMLERERTNAPAPA